MSIIAKVHINTLLKFQWTGKTILRSFIIFARISPCGDESYALRTTVIQIGFHHFCIVFLCTNLNEVKEKEGEKRFKMQAGINNGWPGCQNA